MAGVKGQRNPSKHKRINGWLAGTQEVVRDPQTIAFRPKKGMGDRILADMEAKGLNKQQWCDEVVAAYLGEPQADDDFAQKDVQPEETSITNPLIQDAISQAITTKQAAIRAEQKKKRPDQKLIETWEKEIEELEELV
jgi:hypothetical protein